MIGSAIVRLMPEALVNVPPPALSVTPLLALFMAKLAVGRKVPLSRTNCAALKLAGLPPRLFSAPACTVWLLLTIKGPVKAVLLAV